MGANDDNENVANSNKRKADLRVLRGTVTMQQTKMKNFLETPGRSVPLSELETRLGLLENYLTRFNDIQPQLECEDPEEINSDKRQVYEESYISVKSKILSLIEQKRPRSSLPAVDLGASSLAQRTNASLPKIVIKKFSGNYIDWPDFYATFKTLVEENEGFSNVEKLAYLREALDDGPLQTINNISLDLDGFKNALDLLKTRYENKRLIFQSHIKDLFDLKPAEKNSVSQLRMLSDTIKSHIRALNSVASPEQITDGLLLQLIRNKIDNITLMKWEEEAPLDVLPSWDEFSSFLDKRCQALENSEHGQHISFRLPKVETPNFNSHKTFKQNRRKTSFTVTKTALVCNYCKGSDHEITSCTTFLRLNPIERFNEVKTANLCINCLRAGHITKHCKGGRCRYCNFKHNTLLHRHTPPNQSSGAAVVSAPSDTSSSNDNNLSPSTTALTSNLKESKDCKDPSVDITDVVLATAIVHIKNNMGELIPYRALLDSGSSLHFVSERLVQQLRLKRERANITVSGIGSSVTSVKHKVQVVLESRVNDYCTTFEALVLPKIPKNVVLADPEFNTPLHIDVLIGASLFFELLSVGQIRLGNGRPILQKTLLGWIVSGGRPTSFGNCLVVVDKPSRAEESLEQLVQKFWEVEDYKPSSKIYSSEERACEHHFVEHVQRDHSGRFVVRLPFRKSPDYLGNSLEVAQKRYFGLEQRLSKNSELKQQYLQFMDDYRATGHMEKIPFHALPKQHYFLPHHCVFKPDSSSTKLRVVFDASCKTITGYSLNDVLMVGPVVQDDLFTILLRFRSHKYALTADISKMYRQVRLHPEDTKWQCILWRDSPQSPLEANRLLTVTYGTSPASYLATRCLQQLAQDERIKYPVGATVLQRDFYVDDMLTGADSIAEAMKIRTEVDQLLRSGGFTLSKWCSNSSELLSSIDDANLEKYLQICGDNVIKTLGMIWQPQKDVFRFVYKASDNQRRATKRLVLSSISRLFDPVGLLNPIIVKAKIFLQQLWSLKLSWDESLPQALHAEWISFYSQLEFINHIKIPRYVMPQQCYVELHSFADASMSAYGGCVYIRSIDNGIINCSLLTAKSRVAPLKTISIPRLELCAALLSAELTSQVNSIFASSLQKVYCWSDSSIALSWISSAPSKWNVFVSNRIAKIQELTSNFEWRHVSSENNPADLISRGTTPSELSNSEFWFNGPEFLHFPEHLWPKTLIDVNKELPEGRRSGFTLITGKSTDLIEDSKFSNSYCKLINTFAYIYRFYLNSKIRSKDSSERTRGQLTVRELDLAQKSVIRLLQKTKFVEEYNRLTSGKIVGSNSPLKCLDPFIDSDGLIRAGGRLKNSNLEYDAKHPILLPKSQFTKALIKEYHFRHFHAGCQTLLCIIRTKFWPISGKGMVKQAIRSCVRCFRLRPKVMEQIMGQLPSPRVEPSPVFHHTGVDFCGPFYIKNSVRNRPSTKVYVCLFICISVKAVHLEVASSLSTESFLSVLLKFVARRPHVSIIYSDNATNFVGGSRELKELKALFNSQQHCEIVKEMCRKDGIEWKFIPPRSPHFGGLWEAAIKQAKYHLRRILGIEAYSLDELQRVVCQVESILNSRPLTPLSSDVQDLEPLTPGHFLTGGQMVTIPEPSLVDVDAKLLSRWQHLQAKIHIFWSRWQKEYLQLLQRRAKWRTTQPNIEAGTLVLLKDENIPPLKWPLGRIEELHRGADGHVRVVTVRTLMGQVKRAITKICPLPVDKEDC